MGLSAFDDKFYDHQKSKVITTSFAEITFDKPRLLQLDGEVIGLNKTVKIELLEGAVKLITNKGHENIS